MDKEPASLEESFHNCFFYFVQAVDVLSLSAPEQCEAMGNFNVAQEIQQDVHDNGVALINWPVAYLSLNERNAITKLLSLLMELPEAALSRGDHKKAMSHPGWTNLRIAARELHAQLEHAIKRNGDFFNTVKRSL